MVLGTQVEWAIHCCAVLASTPPDTYVSTRTLARFHGVPKEYLSKALQALSRARLVEGVLGPSGGYRLARPAKDITVLDIVEAVEGKGPSFVCTEIRRNNPCRPEGFCDAGPCAVARVMHEADAAWRARLRRERLSGLLRRVAADVPADLLAASRDWLETDKG